MKRSPNKTIKESRSSTELGSVLWALNAYAKSLNYNKRNGEAQSIRALRAFVLEVGEIRLSKDERNALWTLFDNLSDFQIKVRSRLKLKTEKERDKSLRSWGAFAILTVALFLVVVMFLFGLLTSSSWMVLACFGCSSVALAVVALFFYGEYGKACDLLRSVIAKVDLIKDVDVKIEQLNETLSRPS